MTDNLIIDPKSGGNACYYLNNDGHEVWYSYSSGFASDSTKVLGSEAQIEFESKLPQLYQDLKWIDPSTNLVWYPTSYNQPSKGMVFAEGTSIEDWKWSAVVAVPLTAFEKGKFPKGTDYKMDLSKLKQFERENFMDALEYIGYFN